MEYISGIACALLGTVAGAFGAFYLKQASGKSFQKILLQPKLYAGVVFYGLGILLFIVASKFDDLHIIFPVTALTYVWSLILAKFALNEHITSLRAIAIIIVTLGVVLAVL